MIVSKSTPGSFYLIPELSAIASSFARELISAGRLFIALALVAVAAEPLGRCE